MTFRLILFTLLISSSLFSQEHTFENVQLSKDQIIDKRENFFLTATDYRIAPKVNPVTGEYSEEETDLIVAGSQPLSLRRFYNHMAPYDPRYASWRYNPESFLFANFEWSPQEIFASIGDVDGSVCNFKQSKNDHCTFKYEVSKSFAITSGSGQSHPLNSRINFWTVGDQKDKHRSISSPTFENAIRTEMKLYKEMLGIIE